MTCRESCDNVAVGSTQRGHQFSCGRVPGCWSRTDSFLLTCLLVGACLLIITVSIIWTSYLQTSDYHRGQCLVRDVRFVGPRRCTSGSTACSIIDTAASLPITTPSYHGNINVSSMTATGQPTVMANTTVTSYTARSNVAPETTLSLCSSFPCYQVSVEYAITMSGYVLNGNGQLYSSYAQLRAYPECAYSACVGNDDDSDNDAVVNSSLAQRLSSDGLLFTCYVNVDDELPGSLQPVLESISYTSSVAINSVLWPAVFSSICLLALIGHVVWSNCPSCRRRLVRKHSAATTSSESQQRQSNTRPSLGRQPNLANSIAQHNFDNRHMDLTDLGLPVSDNSSMVWFTPPPYDQVDHATDPPPYEEIVITTTDVDITDPAGYF